MMSVFLGIVVVLLVAVIAIYFVAPGVMFNALMQLTRRQAGLRLRTVEVDGHTVPYLEGGTGTPLLLLHGFGANKDHWTMIARFLTPHFHLYVPDLPGFGDASRISSAHYGVDAQLDRLQALTRSLGLEKFHLGGNSMGGYLAALYAHRHPDDVVSLWLLAPAGAMSAAPSVVLQAMEQGNNPLITTDLAGLDRLTELVFTQAPPFPAQFKRPVLARAQAEAAFNEKIFTELFNEPLPLEGTIDGLATRTLLVWGDDDQVLDCSGLEVIGGLLANAETNLMPRMGHVPMLERPAETAADYLRFQAGTATR